MTQNGRGMFHDCDIFGNSLPGVGVSESGDPHMTKCVIRDSEANGVFVFREGLGQFVECEVRGNTLAGIEVRDKGEPTMHECSIHDTVAVFSKALEQDLGAGVLVWKEGGGKFVGCNSCDNATKDWDVQDGCLPQMVP